MVDPVLQAALEADAPFLLGALKIEFPDYTLCLLDGSGEITFGGHTYLGIDETFGAIESIDAIEESIGNEAPEIRLTLNPADGAASATLASSLMQGSRVTIFLGAFDPMSNSTIGQPEALFYGEIDVPTIDLSHGSRQVSYTIVTVFERLFEVAEGERASDGFHQSIWPGELGLEFMTGTVKTLYWGAKRPITSSPNNMVTIAQMMVSRL